MFAALSLDTSTQTQGHRVLSSRKLLCEWDNADQPILTAVSREGSEWWKKKTEGWKTHEVSQAAFRIRRGPKWRFWVGELRRRRRGSSIYDLKDSGAKSWTGGSGLEDLCWSSECKGSSERGTWAAVPLMATRRQEKGKIPQSEKLKTVKIYAAFRVRFTGRHRYLASAALPVASHSALP